MEYMNGLSEEEYTEYVQEAALISLRDGMPDDEMLRLTKQYLEMNNRMRCKPLIEKWRAMQNHLLSNQYTQKVKVFCEKVANELQKYAVDFVNDDDNGQRVRKKLLERLTSLFQARKHHNPAVLMTESYSMQLDLDETE
jgi:hypothetical protein